MRDNYTGGALTETMLLVLLCLEQPRHGYAVGKRIAELTDNRVQLGMGTLYGALNNLQKKAWITEVSRIDGKINYQRTSAGDEQIKAEYQRLRELLTLIELTGGITC